MQSKLAMFRIFKDLVMDVLATTAPAITSMLQIPEKRGPSKSTCLPAESPSLEISLELCQVTSADVSLHFFC